MPDAGLLAEPVPAWQPLPPQLRQALITTILQTYLKDDAEYQTHRDKTSLTCKQGLVDYLFRIEDEPHGPDDIFDRLRWGGIFVYLSRTPSKLIGLADHFQQRGFEVLTNGSIVRDKRLGLRLPLLCPPRYLFVARKILLIRPRELTERFTYHVELQRATDKPDQWIVLKQVPSVDRVIARLRAKFPGMAMAELQRRALKFTEKIFPLFLTREAAILRILERHLPTSIRQRVPHVINMEQDHRGYVRKLWINWLRNGGAALSQIEFARQSAELLMSLHEMANVIHLDLRLDNFVITEKGVGFVDFGSSVRVNENISGNPLLATIFDELMHTSEIQRMLTNMKHSGGITSHIINAAHHKVDKAVDLFYLAVQINRPTTNPELRDLINYDPASPQALELKQLTDEILRPKDPAKPTYCSAKDVLHGIERIARKLS